MASPTLITMRARQMILDGWAAGRTGAEMARELGLPAYTVHNTVVTARRQGDPRAALRNPGAARRPEPVVYRLSRAYLDVSLARVRARTEAWERSEMGRRMREIAVPPEGEASDA
ncbi:hypothetical protein EEDFHM_03851 [Methylorubrum populi]